MRERGDALSKGGHPWGRRQVRGGWHLWGLTNQKGRWHLPRGFLFDLWLDRSWWGWQTGGGVWSNTTSRRCTKRMLQRSNVLTRNKSITVAPIKWSPQFSFVHWERWSVVLHYFPLKIIIFRALVSSLKTAQFSHGSQLKNETRKLQKWMTTKARRKEYIYRR